MFLFRPVLLLVVATVVSACSIPIMPMMFLLKDGTPPPAELRDMPQTPQPNFEKPAPEPDSNLA